MEQPAENHLSYLGFRLIAPGRALSPYVKSYWYFRRERALAVYREEFMHPQGGYGIVFNFGDPLWLDGQLLTEPILLDGANTFSRKMGFLGQVELLGIRFHEGGAYPFLTIPLFELRNETAALDVLDRPPLLRLYERLCETTTLPVRINLLEQWLVERLSLGKTRDMLIPASLALQRQGQGRLSIPELTERCAIGQRQLERLYRVQVGISPKQYARLLRVEAARLALKGKTYRTHADLAADLGFYDEAHFIREFSAGVGMTPARYRQYSQKRD